MKLYQPIDGLLSEDRSRRRWLPWLVLAVVLASLLVSYGAYVVVVGREVAQERRVEQGAPHLVAAGLASDGVLAARELALKESAAAQTAILDPGGEGNASTNSKATGSEVPKPNAKPKAAEKNPSDGVETKEAPTKTAAAAQKTPPSAAAPGGVVMGKAGRLKGRIDPGQSLYQALVGQRFTAKQISPAVNALSKVVDFRRTRAGHRWSVEYDNEGWITQLDYQGSAEIVHVARRQKGTRYKLSEKKVPTKTLQHGVGGTIRTSVYKALRDLGEDHSIIRQFIDIFQYDIDFAVDSKPGDTFRLVYEKVYLDGKFVRNGRMLAAGYKGKVKSLRAYYYGPGGDTSRRTASRCNGCSSKTQSLSPRSPASSAGASTRSSSGGCNTTAWTMRRPLVRRSTALRAAR